ncbi:PREDICTED: uncharacterized protein LOC104537943, partial [Mesitornis unicolor]|uniref:uncharacterized protein LOC104537943 n=1 Tax=Mesitornis unicolor TaxID=54374 RepID=UPI000528E6EF
PQNVYELRAFLGMTGWCRLWIMNYGLIAKPLYEAQKAAPFVWEKPQQEDFRKLKEALMTAPALGLPDLTKDFQLFVHERQHLALGVLTQRMGSWKRPVGYFSKQLDSVSKEWPSCLRAVAATVILIQEAGKLTLRKTITIYVPHMVTTVLEQKGGHWLSHSRMMKCQVICTEQDDVILKTTNPVNPAVFLNTPQEEQQLEHDCTVTIEHTYSSREDLKDVPFEKPDWEPFTDCSSFVLNGTRYAGYAVTTENTMVEAHALPITTSAQKAELIALIQALELSKGKKANIWTDSKYAFDVVHVHGALWKERGILSSQRTNIKHQKEILQLLLAVQEPAQILIMYCKAHQSGNTKIIEGNRSADQTAKKAALQHTATQMALIPTRTVKPSKESPKYSGEVDKLAQLVNAMKNQEGWWVTSQGQVVVPLLIMREILQVKHHECHWGAEALVQLLKRNVISVKMLEMAKSVSAKCEICLKNNPVVRKKVQLGRTKTGVESGDYWQTDFTELPKCIGYKYMLIGVDTFSGWPEAFSCHTNQAKETVKWLLQEIIARFGVPLGMSSDRGPHFVATVVQETWNEESLQERWKGPCQVRLTTFTAIKIAKSDAWIHYTRVKTPPPVNWKVVGEPETLKLTLKHD